jgi:hypothetical protein
MHDREYERKLTFCDLELGNRLPSIHRHAPAFSDTTTTEIDDELIPIAIEVLQYRLQSLQ